MWCKRPKCKTCNILIEAKNHINIYGKKLIFNANMSCITSNVIYILFCNGCTEIYVGETSINLSLRMNLHRNHIENTNYRHFYVSKHIKNCGNSAFKVIPIYQVPNKSDYLRRKMEIYFISILNPKLNSM